MPVYLLNRPATRRVLHPANHCLGYVIITICGGAALHAHSTRCALQNIDVVRPVLPPKGANIARCSTTLMPWSPFPCSFDNKKFNSSRGQPSDLCYNRQNSSRNSSSPFEGFDLARSLTTDG
jgi:hypothetical protein